ncbi:MAG: hypothetical protein K2H32_07470 [Muribaculaceae bacterium]|nr:hypothetical protein [Muribaculaceae bacterium]
MKKNYLIILLGFALASCSDTPIDDKQDQIKDDSEKVEEVTNEIEKIEYKPSRNIELSDVERSVNKQQVDFSINFFKAAQKEMANKNFVVSPYSVATALSMLANGAGGNTAVELQNVLLGEGTELSDLNEYNKKIASEIDTLDNYTKLEIANGIFPDKNVNLVSGFIDNNKN